MTCLFPFKSGRAREVLRLHGGDDRGPNTNRLPHRRRRRLSEPAGPAGWPPAWVAGCLGAWEPGSLPAVLFSLSQATGRAGPHLQPTSLHQHTNSRIHRSQFNKVGCITNLLKRPARKPRRQKSLLNPVNRGHNISLGFIIYE